MAYEEIIAQAQQEESNILTVKDILVLDKKYFSSRAPKGIMFTKIEEYVKNAEEKYRELPIKNLEELTGVISAIHKIIWQRFPEIKDREDKEKSVLKTKKQEINSILEKIIDRVNEIIKSNADKSPDKLLEIIPKHIFTVFFADYLRFEVGNGGYSQFIRNSKALYNELTETALVNLGANELLERHRKIVGFINNNPQKAKIYIENGSQEIRDEIDYLMETKFPQNTKYYDLKPSLFDYIHDYINKYRTELLDELTILSKENTK